MANVLKMEQQAAIRGLLELGWSYRPASCCDLIAAADSLLQPRERTITVMLAGRDASGDYFIWQKTHEGMIANAAIAPDKISWSTASNRPRSTTGFCSPQAL